MDYNREKENMCLLAVRNGDSQACAALLEEYHPLTESMVTYVLARVSADAEEVRSEVQFAIYRAALSYDSEKSTMTFGLYAKICVKNHLTSRFFRRKSAPTAVSLDELENMHACDELYADETDIVGDEESLLALHGKIREVLSTYELTVFHLWLDGFSAKEISERVSRDEKSVTNAISRSLTKLRTALQ